MQILKQEEYKINKERKTSTKNSSFLDVDRQRKHTPNRLDSDFSGFHEITEYNFYFLNT